MFRFAKNSAKTLILLLSALSFTSALAGAGNCTEYPGKYFKCSKPVNLKLKPGQDCETSVTYSNNEVGCPYPKKADDGNTYCYHPDIYYSAIVCSLKGVDTIYKCDVNNGYWQKLGDTWKCGPIDGIKAF